MQDKNKRKISNLKEKLKNKKVMIMIISIILLASCIIVVTPQVIKQIKIKQIEDRPLLEYEVKNKLNKRECEILVKVNSVDGIETIKYLDNNGKEIQLNCKGKVQVGLDLKAEDRKDYEFKIKVNGKEETTEVLHFELPRVHGNYALDDGVYVYEPDIKGYNKNYTRYLDIDSNGNLTPGNWLDGDKPTNWYNYSDSQWANIYVETNGLETYYVWIPRYCFKLDQQNQRSDVKFINVYDEYKDENGNITEWEELEALGYQIPEAFTMNNTEIPGYWMMKYTLGERNVYTISYDAIASKTKITFKTLSVNTTETIAKYTYAINGQILKESETLDEFIYEMTTEGSNIVNITALNANGEIVGSMTKECVQAKVNPPDLSGFDKETTFYVTYDENQNEHCIVPINQVEPENWYDYGDTKWANIVTRNNGLETYYTWIPRYEFKLDQTTQRSNVNFLEGTKTETSQGYQIPEAFTFNGEQLTGYWMMKYTLGNAMAPRFDSEMTATSSTIKTKGIIGTAIAEGQVYKYYINGEYKGEKTTSSDIFEFTDLEINKQYVINIEIRNATTDEYLGSVTKKVKTVDANKPDLTGFNEDCTYYVLYDENENEIIGENIKKDGSNMPSNWYDYSRNRWANIVVKGNGTTTYYTWIPRYEYMITSAQYAQPAIGRTEVRFLEGISTDVDIGYQIPEAFTFNGEQLTGYWMMKYTVGQ